MPRLQIYAKIDFSDKLKAQTQVLWTPITTVAKDKSLATVNSASLSMAEIFFVKLEHIDHHLEKIL